MEITNKNQNVNENKKTYKWKHKDEMKIKDIYRQTEDKIK